MSSTAAGLVFIVVAGRGPGAGPSARWATTCTGSTRATGTPASRRAVYRLIGVNPKADQRWSGYLRGVLAFSLVGVLFLYAFLRLQNHLLLSLGFPGMEQSQAFNTAASFVTNTNWQSYSGESALSVTWCRWRAWPCRTSCRPRSACPSQSP